MIAARQPCCSSWLLIMGAMASGVWWPRSFCAQLANRGRFVIRYDHRDTGRSTNYGPGGATYSTETLAADALTILDAYNVETAHLLEVMSRRYEVVHVDGPAKLCMPRRDNPW